MISVSCHYGDGTRPLDSITDSLIITEADGINRGYAELNKAWKIIDSYTVSMPYPTNGYLLEVGKHIKVTCAEVGLINQVLYIQGVSISGNNKGTMISLTLETYQAFEADARPSAIDAIDDGTPSDNYESIVDGGTPTVPYTDIIEGGSV